MIVFRRDFSHYHLREVANVKHLNAIQKKSINRKRKNRKRNRNGKNKARVGMNVVDARYKLLQKALEKPTVIDAREKINERHLQSILYDVSNYLLLTTSYLPMFGNLLLNIY